MENKAKNREIEELLRENERLKKEHKKFISDHNKLQAKYESLKFSYKSLQRLLFGIKTERFVSENNPLQGKLPFESELEETKDKQEKETVTYQRKKKTSNHKGRLAFPSHLEVREEIIEPKEDVSDMVKIGEEVTEKLEHTPASLFIQRIIRPKYALKKDVQLENQERDLEKKTILIGELPSFAIPKGSIGNGLLSQIMVDKFVDHLPYYRQIARFKREKVEINASTINNWQKQTAFLLEPLYDAMKTKILSQGYIQADESPISVMDSRKKKKTHTGYHWVYYTPLEKMVLFDYQESRGKEAPHLMLKNFKGYLQTDGYKVYDEFHKKEGITLCGCMAHARRYFEKALDNDKTRSEYVLLEIQKLYQIERKLKEEKADYQTKYNYRLEQARPVLEDLVKWLFKQQEVVLPKSPIGKAIQYTLSRWEYLTAYLFDGALEIDNNLVENTIRTLAIGRKNYLFAGSHDGAKIAAMFYSFFGTCKKHGVNPYEWLKFVLDNINDYKISELENLFPQNVKF